jgi:hypothetical protein
MSGIRPLLESTQAILSNTRPRALVEFSAIWAFPPFSSYRPLTDAAPNTTVEFNVTFLNVGSDVAKDPVADTRLYFGRPRSLEDQRRFIKDFDEQWPGKKHYDWPFIDVNGVVNFTTSIQVTEEDLRAAVDHEWTIYILSRVEYNDSFGHLIYQRCAYLQDPTHDLLQAHPCKLFNKNPALGSMMRTHRANFLGDLR